MSAYPEYSLAIAIAQSCSQTSATREVCDTKTKDLVWGNVIPVNVQSSCSYSVYVGPEYENVVQFRLASLILEPETIALVRELYGSLVPSASFHGQLGEEGENLLFVYCMNQIPVSAICTLSF